MLNLNAVDPEDISYDEYGKWGKPSGRKIYIQSNEKGRLIKIAEGKQPVSPWMVVVRRNRYVHESAESGEFSKITYIARDHEGNIAIGFAVLTYSVGINPQEVKALPHKGARDQQSSYQHVKPSMLILVSCMTSKPLDFL